MFIVYIYENLNPTLIFGSRGSDEEVGISNTRLRNWGQVLITLVLADSTNKSENNVKVQ